MKVMHDAVTRVVSRTIRTKIYGLVLMTGATFLSGCELSVSSSESSGNEIDDYIEAPVSDSSSSFSGALDTSNKFVRFISEGKFHDAYDLFKEEFKANATEREFREQLEYLSSVSGAMLEYLPQQWGFITYVEEDVPMLYSTKIVVHNEGSFFYIFAFERDGEYDSIAGIQVQPRRSNDRIDNVLELLAVGE